MYNSDDLVKFLKQAAVEAVNASKPANMVFGKVISASPLKIQVEQKMILTSMQLILCRNVTDYTVQMTANQITESYLIHNALQVNDSVVLMQVSGGQKYVVIDRIG